MYLDDVEPVLREGMDFLRDEGLAIGCYANRYMQVLDRLTASRARSPMAELVEEPRRAGALGGIASDPCAGFSVRR